jgi:hypothetical protein
VRRLWVLRPPVTGWTWVVRPWLKLHPKTEPIQSNPHCSKARNVAGVRLGRDLRPFGWCSTNRKNCGGSG